MFLKISQFFIQDKNSRDIDNGREFPIISDLIKDENRLKNKAKSVHRRRDLGCLD